MENKKTTKTTKKKTSTTKKKTEASEDKKYIKKPKSISTSLPKEIEIPSMDMAGDDMGTSEVIDINSLDPMKYPDCWITLENEPVLDDKGRPLLNYSKLQERLKAEKWEFELAKSKGEYVSKMDVIISVKTIAMLITTGLETIPNRYASTLMAEAKRITGHEFTEQEKTVIRSHLKNVSAEIMKSLQQEIRNLID